MNRTEECICPTCGGEWDRPDIIKEPGVLIVRGRRIGLTRREDAVVELLVRRLGKYVSRDALIMQMYSDEEEPEYANNTLSIIVHRARKKFDGAACQIESKSGFGFRLVVSS